MSNVLFSKYYDFLKVFTDTILKVSPYCAVMTQDMQALNDIYNAIAYAKANYTMKIIYVLDHMSKH